MGIIPLFSIMTPDRGGRRSLAYASLRAVMENCLPLVIIQLTCAHLIEVGLARGHTGGWIY